MARENNAKAKYWTGVLYQENMVASWESDIGDLLELPYAYCVHNLDVDAKSEHRKDHIHLIVVFNNTTTYNNALRVFRQLGEKAVNTIKPVISIRHMYDYLIHDTEDSRKKGKYLYPKEARITGNGFDIGAYEQISAAEKRELVMEMCSHISQKKFTNFADFFDYEIAQAGDNAMAVSEAIMSYSGLFERLTRGAFQRAEREQLKAERQAWFEALPANNSVKKNWHIDEESGELVKLPSSESGVEGEDPSRKRD